MPQPDIHNPITDNLDLWTSVTVKKATTGRGSKGKVNAYGIQKLRELILELAIRGQLVPHDPDGQPASELLDEIARQKVDLVANKEIKKAKSLPALSSDDEFFDLPRNWCWARLQDLATYIQRGKGPKYSENGRVLVVSQKCVQWSGFDLERARRVDDSSLSAYQKERFLKKRDLLWNSTGTGTVGRVNVLDIETDGSLVADSHVTVIRPIGMNSNFLWCCLAAPGVQLRIDPDHEQSLVSGTTKQVELNTSSVIALPVPVPPLAEQHRIVAKVDELMALCDQLEQQQTDSREAHQTLVETLLNTLTQAADFEATQQAWQRIAEHFDTLFTTEASIDQLKQTVLQLAVTGKLVSQSESEKPAEDLLDQIESVQRILVDDGALKKIKKLGDPTAEECAFSAPKGWRWVKFGSLAEFINGDRSKNYPNKSEYVTEGVAWINTGHIEPEGCLTATEMNFITREKFDSLRSGKIKPGDLVYCLRGATFGKTAFVDPYSEGAIASSLMIIRPFVTETNSYIYKYLISPFGKAQLFRFDNGSAQPNLSANSVGLYVFPLPPLEEQHRIVAKVDELMALCDALKARLQEAQTTQVHLADAVVEQAVA
ncbi:MAG: restriction endonuclease subunit S [Gammaproteobacteria bacterium]